MQKKVLSLIVALVILVFLFTAFYPFYAECFFEYHCNGRAGWFSRTSFQTDGILPAVFGFILTCTIYIPIIDHIIHYKRRGVELSVKNVFYLPSFASSARWLRIFLLALSVVYYVLIISLPLVITFGIIDRSTTPSKSVVEEFEESGPAVYNNVMYEASNYHTQKMYGLCVDYNSFGTGKGGETFSLFFLTVAYIICPIFILPYYVTKDAWYERQSKSGKKPK